eukprot:6230766-Prymnesium_polylepis.1
MSAGLKAHRAHVGVLKDMHAQQEAAQAERASHLEAENAQLVRALRELQAGAQPPHDGALPTRA